MCLQTISENQDTVRIPEAQREQTPSNAENSMAGMADSQRALHLNALKSFLYSGTLDSETMKNTDYMKMEERLPARAEETANVRIKSNARKYRNFAGAIADERLGSLSDF